MKPGDKAPDFTLPDEDGVSHSLRRHLTEGPVVLFFYPAAMTAGCTKQACHFRDLGAEFERIGAARFGISTDAVRKQKEFAEIHDFGYPLLSDRDGTVARDYGVKRKLLSAMLPVKRTTFVIGKDGIVLDVIRSETNMRAHADRALAALVTESSTD